MTSVILGVGNSKPRPVTCSPQVVWWMTIRRLKWEIACSAGTVIGCWVGRYARIGTSTRNRAGRCFSWLYYRKPGFRLRQPGAVHTLVVELVSVVVLRSDILVSVLVLIVAWWIACFAKSLGSEEYLSITICDP